MLLLFYVVLNVSVMIVSCPSLWTMIGPLFPSTSTPNPRSLQSYHFQFHLSLGTAENPKNSNSEKRWVSLEMLKIQKTRGIKRQCLNPTWCFTTWVWGTVPHFQTNWSFDMARSKSRRLLHNFRLGCRGSHWHPPHGSTVLDVSSFAEVQSSLVKPHFFPSIFPHFPGEDLLHPPFRRPLPKPPLPKPFPKPLGKPPLPKPLDQGSPRMANEGPTIAIEPTQVVIISF